MDYDKLEWHGRLEWKKGVSTFCQYMCEVGVLFIFHHILQLSQL